MWDSWVLKFAFGIIGYMYYKKMKLYVQLRIPAVSNILILIE